MNTSNTEQLFKIIDSHKSALILLSKNYNGDSLAASLALSLYLKKYGKKSIIAIENLNIDKKFKFLPENNLITNIIFDPSKITIRVKTDRIKAKELSYEPKEDSIEIYINSATNDGFKKEDIEIIEENVDFDYVFTVGIKNKEDIGLYQENIKFFENKDLINIDIDPNNTKYGNTNIISSDQKSLSELIFDIISFNKSELIDENISTCILTGIMDKTNGFKSLDISSNTLSNASNLIDLGANKDLISKNLFKNKNLEEIKNTSKVLLNTTSSDNIFYSINEGLNGIINIKSIFNDNIIQIDNAEVFLVFNKKDSIVYAEITCSNKYSAVELSSDFKSIGNNELAQFAIASPDIEKVAEIVIKKIKNKITE